MSWTGYQQSEFCLKQGKKISDICLKQGQGMWGRAAPPHPGIHRVPPPGILATWMSLGDSGWEAGGISYLFCARPGTMISTLKSLNFIHVLRNFYVRQRLNHVATRAPFSLHSEGPVVEGMAPDQPRSQGLSAYRPMLAPHLNSGGDGFKSRFYYKAKVIFSVDLN